MINLSKKFLYIVILFLLIVTIAFGILSFKTLNTNMILCRDNIIYFSNAYKWEQAARQLAIENKVLKEIIGAEKFKKKGTETW